MTNKEAIEILTNIKNTPQITWTNGADVAFDLAIEVLEEKDRQKSCDNCKNFFDTESCICKKCIRDTMKYFSQWQKKETDND